MKSLINWFKTCVLIISSYCINKEKLLVNDDVMLKGDPNKWYILSLKDDKAVIRRVDQRSTFQSKTVLQNELSKI